ncbi:adenylyltransferase/cytidyltransferase family protein [Candidatus Pacearchaeota archaeon]|nr:adenylyltransferase/cytidyltransferase family protein [Candidatus Pacearchaeota archaeon]
MVDKVQKLKATGTTIVLCHGVFDLLHIGHIRYLRQARKFGDVLVVTITMDQYVDKGPHRPAFPQELRAEGIASLDCIDFVAINEWSTAEETLRRLRPNYYVKGAEFKDMTSDLTGKIGRESDVLREVGAKLVFAEDIVYSSSNLINRYLSTFSEEVNDFLTLFRSRYSLSDILETIDKMASLKVMVVGDTILDEYQYCTALGISSKDPTIALKYQSQEIFAGGVLAVANQVANFVDNVQLVTLLGDKNRSEKFIRSQLDPKVTPYFITQPNSPTLVKRRFIDGYSFNKLFEVYEMDDSGLPAEEDDRLCNWLSEQLPRYDLVIVADFGHGAVSEKMVEVLSSQAPYLAINTQANAGNRGYHAVTRYPRADFVSLASHEMQLATQTKYGNERILADQLARQLGCKHFVVTLGRRGCIVWDGANNVEVPAFAQDVIDRIGAGDAFFSITSLASKLSAPIEILGFLGNVVGAEAVRVLGNQKSIEKMSIKKHLTSLLK